MTITRRSFLTLSAIAAATAPQRILGRPARREEMLQMNGYAINAETPLELLTDYRTPNELFFVRSHWSPHMPNIGSWRLAVDGEVDEPRTWTLAELRKFPMTDVTCVLQCAGNGRGLYAPTLPGVQWRFGAVGNAHWRGVRVRDVLDRSGLKASAKHLHAFGSDDPPGNVPPFHRSVELEKVLADGILALDMNGKALPPLHGAPLRLVVPGWAGDHWMKWLTRIEARREPQKGFYMETAYRYPVSPGEPGVTVAADQMRPVTELYVKSNITTAPKRVHVGQTHEIHGFAFSGAPDIALVEISDDGGVTWSDAALDPRHDPYAWRLWSFRWTPRKAGTARLTARATDSRGSVQPREASWNQSGYLYNGWHAVNVEVLA